MAENQLNRQLAAGIRAAQQGDRERARELLEGVLRQDRNNEQAWIWLASVVESQRERRLSLERVLKINPNNEAAQEALNSMVGVLGSGEANIDYMAISAAARTPIPSVGRRSDASPSPAQRQAGGGGSNRIPLLVGIVLVLGLLLAGSFFVPQLLQPEPTDVPTVVAVVEQTEEATLDPFFTPPSPTIRPSATFSGTIVTVERSFTAVPTFTPTASPTASDTPAPTNTLPPRTNYDLVLLGIQGAASSSIYTLNGDGTGLTNLMRDVHDFDYNPDTGLIVFTRAVFVAQPTREPTATFTPVLVSPTPDPNQPPRSSGGGLALTGSNQIPDVLQFEMYIANINSMDDLTPITSSALPSAFSPSISPDGRYVAYASDNDGDVEIYVYTVATRVSTKITNNFSIEDTDPDWSPDGTRLVFSSDRLRPTNNDLFTIDPFADDPESTIVQITDSRGKNIQPQWSPTADELVFLNINDDETTIRYATVNGLIIRDLTFNPSWVYTNPSWTRDGNYILYSSGAPDASELGLRIYSPELRIEETVRIINLNVIQAVQR